MPLPKDNQNSVAQLVPATTSLATTKNTSISSSTEIVLNAKTTLIEVQALDGNVYLKWGTDNVSSADDGYDEFIQKGNTRHYFVPVEDEDTKELYGAINVIDDGDSAGVVIIEK